MAAPAVWKEGVPLLIGDLTVLEAVSEKLSLPAKLRSVKDTSDIAGSPDELPVMDLGMVPDPASLQVGHVSALAGKASVAYIRKAVELCMSGTAAGVATTPINKEALKAAKEPYIGHTEMLAEMSGATKSYTMFLVDKLRIHFHSRHLSLKQAIEVMTTDDVIHSIETAAKCLASIGLPAGTIALAALNPHASDGGSSETRRPVSSPCRGEARRRGINVVGPVRRTACSTSASRESTTWCAPSTTTRATSPQRPMLSTGR
jgi:4-hydroxythreonine-4-phosphate dehydrogenase